MTAGSGWPLTPLAVADDEGRAAFVARPDATLRDLGLTEVRYLGAYHQDVEEAAAVLRAAGTAGLDPYPPLFRLRLRVISSLANLKALDRERRDAASRILWAQRHREPDMPALQRFAEMVAPSDLATLIQEWAALYRSDPLVPPADYCSQVLYDHGYYDRQRALESLVIEHLTAPEGGWPDLPAYLGTDFSIIRDVRVGERLFFRHLDEIERLLHEH